MKPFVPERISLASGAGGRAMRNLVESIFLNGVTSPPGAVGADAMDDGAAIPLGNQWLVMTTDSYVVKPLFFPGGDIGRLAICGTVNDLAMMGATNVLGLTCGIIIEEGFARSDLERIQASLQAACAEAGVHVVTGDTKVMARGELDGVVLNTAGVALCERVVRDCTLQPGDRLVVTGTVGDHGMAIAALRADVGIEGDLRSDVAPLRSLIAAVLNAVGEGVTAMKDPTRGGVASALFEMAQKSGVSLLLDGPAVPIRHPVRATAELLGIEPLHVANEGKALIGVRPEALETVLAVLRAHPLGRDAAVIGVVTSGRPGEIVLDTGMGKRLLHEPEGEPLPRIC